jgi:hypothetical protein
MTLPDYYEILDLPFNSSIQEIKKAYRVKARLYHPDINPSPEAKDLFIRATEAYEFLLANHDKIKTDDQAYSRAMENWRKYRQYRSRYRATVYARSSYGNFKKSSLYRTTRFIDGTIVIYGLVISSLIIINTVYGYVFKLNHPVPGQGKPSVLSFIVLLSSGIIFFSAAIFYFIAYRETLKKHKK